MKKKKAPVEEAWTHTSENWVDSSAWDSLMEVLNDGWEKIAEWPPLELPPLEFPPMEDPWTDLSAGCKDDVESAKPRQIREDAIVLSKEEPKIANSTGTEKVIGSHSFYPTDNGFAVMSLGKQLFERCQHFERNAVQIMFFLFRFFLP